MLVSYSLFCFATFFVIIFLMRIFAEICTIRYSRVILYSQFSLAILLAILVSRTDSSTVYLKAKSIQSFWGVSYLVADKGPLYFLLYIFLGFAIIVSFSILGLSLKQRYEVSKKMIIEILLCVTTGLIIYIVPKLVGIPISFVSIWFTISDYLLLYLLRNFSMYDMTSNILNAYEQYSEHGYLAFDRKKRYTGCNEFAKKIFPELKTIKIDSRITDKEKKLNATVSLWLRDFDKGINKTYDIKYLGFSVRATVKDIKNGKHRIGYLIELHDITKQQQYIDLLDSYNYKLQTEIKTKTSEILQMQNSIITGMASMVESRDNSTGAHINRTSEGVRIFINELQKSEKYKNFSIQFCKDVIKAAPMHDLGKIAVSDQILRKPGKYTKDEFEQMKKHSAEGTKIVSTVLKDVDDDEFKKVAVNIAHYHHERWDGTGYPEGIKKEEIPIEARIMSFVDVFDALVSKRCYKNAFSFDEAFDLINSELGTKFDPDLGEIFISCRPQLEKLYLSYTNL